MGDFIRMMKNQAAVDSGAGVTFTAAVTDICTATAHGFVSGDGPFYLTTDNALPGGLSDALLYYLEKIDANTFYLCKTKAGALAADGRDRIDITSTGTGNHAMHWDHWYSVSKYNLKSVEVTGIVTGDIVRMLASDKPTKPATDDYGAQVGADITADGFRNIPEGMAWLRSYRADITGGGSTNVYFWGKRDMYG